MEVMYRVNKEVVVEQPQVWQSDSDASESANSSDVASEPAQNGGYSGKSGVYLDINEGNTLEWPLLDKTEKVEDIDIPKLINSVMNTKVGINHKDKIASTLSSQTSSSSSGESTTTSTDTQIEKPLRIDLVDEESDEDVIELEFERAGGKVHTHTPYCPNCSSQITKVILRRRKREDPTRSTVVVDPPHREKPVDLFGCLSCFSIFIPSGNVLNPFRLFGAKGKQGSAQIVGGEHAPHADHTAAPGASVNADVSTTTINQVNVFDLFWIFRRKKEDEATPAADSKGKRVEESSDHGNALLDNLSGTLPLSGPQLPISKGYMLPSDTVRYGASKPGSVPEISPTDDSVPSDHLAITVGDGTENVVDRGNSDARGSKPVAVVKCIVYGGLLELITSLSIVSSAAASGASTLNIMALGLATLISTIFVFGHNLVDLKNETFKQDVDEQQTDRYQELLGQRGHFYLHATLALLSFLFFGLVPPLVYAFAFYESDNSDYKILAVAVASFPCVIILAAGQAYVKRTQKLSGYIKVVMYYVTAAITASGIAYAAGDLLNLLMEKLGWFGARTPAAGGSATPTPAWASY